MQGLGIALVAAQRAQVPVTVVDASEQALNKGIAFAGALELFSSCKLSDVITDRRDNREAAGQGCVQVKNHSRAGRSGPRAA